MEGLTTLAGSAEQRLAQLWEQKAVSKSGAVLAVRPFTVDPNTPESHVTDQQIEVFRDFVIAHGGDLDTSIEKELQHSTSALNDLMRSLKDAGSVYEAQRTGNQLRHVAQYITALKDLQSAHVSP